MAHMFAGASNISISGGTFINQVLSQPLAFDKLAAAAAHSALHDAPARTDDTRCHRLTRTNVLDRLEHWALGICDEGASVLWLHGGAGAGKSAIMQTLAERFVGEGLVLGSFFFSRTDPTRNTAEVLLPTLVYQVAQLFPSAMDVLAPIITRDPLVFKKSLRIQLLALFVPALQHLLQLGIISDAPQSPRVFLIDGLDECTNPAHQQAIIQAVTAACHAHHIPVKFCIASRPEHEISASFAWYEKENLILGTISLSQDPDAKADIRRFVEDEFLKVRLQHPFRKMIPSEWPSLRELDVLVWRSSSHFIYASTALRYVWAAKENPVRSLEAVLGLKVSRTTSPFAELDSLYYHILESAAHRDQVLKVLGFCIHAGVISSVSILCIMLDYSPDDLRIFMADMAPLVVLTRVGPFRLHEDYAKVLHASFRDFLRDPSRSGSLYISKDVYLAAQLERCYQLLDLYSRKQRTTPNWPARPSAAFRPPYFVLTEQIIKTIKIAGHLDATQEVLNRYGLRALYQCEQRFNDTYQNIRDVIDHLVRFLIAVHFAKNSYGIEWLFRSFMNEFFDILDSYLGFEVTTLAPTILPLIFLGTPPQDVCEILSYHCRDSPSYQLVATPRWNDAQQRVTVLDLLTVEDLASLRHSATASPERLVVAAEAILGYLMTDVQLYSLSTHKSWIRRKKPGKHIASGAPRLASVFHAKCDRSLRLLEGMPHTLRRQPVDEKVLNSWLQSLSVVLGPRHRLSRDELERQRETLRLVINLLEALLCVLPKAVYSEKIVRYSKRAFPWKIYQHKPELCQRVQRCIDKYTTRVRNAKLEKLGQRIENGDVDALIVKLRMLYLDSQD